jgi:L-threonylcarbamoyladenylate synthase
MIDYSPAIKVLKNSQVAIIPTDTIYGIVAQAYDKSAVERVYQIKNRSLDKPCIILIPDLDTTEKLGVNADWLTKTLDYWPGPNSLILPTFRKDIKHLDKGTGTLALRLPANKGLIELLKVTGPLVAPSANPEGSEPAKNITEAKAYFSDKVNIYIDGGTIVNNPSKLIVLTTGEVVR